MRSLQVTALDGPSSVTVAEVPEPEPGPDHVLVDVRAVGISWPDLLLTKGEYQLKPEVPFQLGVDFSGVVVSAPPQSGFEEGDRVACALPYGGGADLVAVHQESVFPLPDNLTFEQGAALPMNYLTAEFALVTRGQVQSGETVLVHGAAGGVGTACIQVAKGLGARVIGVVSTEEKAAVARAAGADEAVLVEGFLQSVKDLTGGTGVDALVDVVGGELMTDSLRALAPLGRLLVVGFTGGSIPEVKVNRLLLNNTEVIGAGWGAYVMSKPDVTRETGREIQNLIDSGHVRPIVGARFGFEQAADALKLIDERGATGKVVLEL